MQRTPPRALILVLGWASLLLASLTAAAPAITIKDVRLWAGPDATRLVFDLSAPAESNVMTLQNPDRVVIDISGARIDNARTMPEGQGFVKQLRVGPQGKGDLRFVIDLSSPASPRSVSVAPAAS
jgi:N-acetylmuramoyl-L-alanine amidase